MEGTKLQLLTALPNAAKQLAADLQTLELDVHGKTAIVTSVPSASRAVQAGFRSQGVEAQIVQTVRDLGIDNSVGRKRRVKTHKVRLGKAFRRAARAKNITDHNGPGLKIFNTASIPQAFYGHVILV